MIVATLGGAAALLAGCSSKPAPSPATPTPPAAPVVVPGPKAKAPPPSVARTPKEYRQDAARHLYQLNADRIYKGRLPPMLYAIGTLEVLVDRQGNVVALNWLRAPKHAPEVVAEIERTARAAAPYPVPERLGRVTYTDTWLWHKSGRFQLDTLTEGQD
jgi:protein TonB